MGMTPTQYFESFVEGNAFDCHEYPGCVRRAFNAAVSASHLADHGFNYSQRHMTGFAMQFPTLGDYLDYLSQQTNGAFKDIRSIANAYKHLYTSTDQKKAVHSSVSSAGAIVSVDLTEIDADFASLSEDYDGSTLAVIFTRKDGSKSAFLPALDAVIEYWRHELHGGA
ncbi:MAG TPA: hypothetical protein VGL11_07775 [Candidatus Binatia bacterium]|jgi:uncharacterized protein Usg